MVIVNLTYFHNSMAPRGQKVQPADRPLFMLLNDLGGTLSERVEDYLTEWALGTQEGLPPWMQYTPDSLFSRIQQERHLHRLQSAGPNRDYTAGQIRQMEAKFVAHFGYLTGEYVADRVQPGWRASSLVLTHPTGTPV